jgi:hypothetical protein
MAKVKFENLVTSYFAGIFSSLTLLIASLFIPFTPIKFGVVELSGSEITDGKPSGPRLFIGGVHIHHYVFGVILMILAVLGIFLFPKHLLIFVFILGMGSWLVIDQLPNLLGLKPFGLTVMMFR